MSIITEFITKFQLNTNLSLPIIAPTNSYLQNTISSINMNYDS